MKKFWEKISKEKEKKELFNEKTKLIIGDTQDLNQKLMLINDSENLFVFDDKNIYYDFLKNKFKNIRILNLKELANSVHWNPFTYPYYLYKKGDIDTALELVKKIGFNLFRDDDLNVDLYWIDTISDYFSALTIHLFEKESDINSINMTNILELYNQFKQGLLDEYYNKLDNKSLEYKLISTVLNFPREVKLSILAVFNQKMQMVCLRQMLTERLSSDDIRLDKIDFENQKQCIIVVGKTTYNFIANIFINQLYKVLEKKKPKQKINVILDTLDTISKIEELENLLENDSNINLNLTAITENKEKLINKYGERIISLFNQTFESDNSKLQSSIIGFVIGDALGVPVEFMSREQLKNNKITQMEGYGTHNQPKGTWSDDTSMLLATMDAFCDIEGDYVNNHKLYQVVMDNFVSWKYEKKYTPFKQVFDIGNATSTAIEDYKNGYYQKDQTYRANNYNNVNSNGNGSLMRILPIAINLAMKNEIDSNIIDKTCNYISSLTHAHYYSIFACHIFVRYIIELFKTNDKNISYINTKKIINEWLNQNSYGIEETQKLREVYKRILEDDIQKVKENDIKSSGYVVDTLEAVLWTILNTDSFKNAVLTAVNLGDDTDTVGALVGSVAGIIYGYDSIPVEWINDLQNKDLIFDLTGRFISKVSNLTSESTQIEKINEEIKNNELETLKKEISGMFDSFINPEFETYQKESSETYQKQSVDLAIDETRKMYKNVDSKIYEIASSCLKKISQLDEKRFEIIRKGFEEIQENINSPRNGNGILLLPKLDRQDIQIIMKNKYNNLQLIKLTFVNKNVLELLSIIHFWLHTDKGYVDSELDYEFFIAIFRKILEITSLADNDNDSKINQITLSYLKKIKELNEEKIELLLKSLKEIKENIETPRDDNGMILSPKLDISDIQNLTYNKLEFKNKNVLELLSFIDFKSQIDRDCINNESIYKLLIKIIREISEITNENIVKQYLHTKLWNVLSDEEIDEIFNDIKQKNDGIN